MSLTPRPFAPSGVAPLQLRSPLLYLARGWRWKTHLFSYLFPRFDGPFSWKQNVKCRSLNTDSKPTGDDDHLIPCTTRDCERDRLKRTPKVGFVSWPGILWGASRLDGERQVTSKGDASTSQHNVPSRGACFLMTVISVNL